MKKALKRTHEFKDLTLNLDDKTKHGHTIYFKEHSVRDHSSDKPSGRTLLILNLPPYVDEQGLKNAFSAAGAIKSVQFSSKPSAAEAKNVTKFIPEICNPCFRVAYLVFDKVAQLHKALALQNLQPLNKKDHKVLVGMKKWITEYNNNIWQPKVLKETIETFMTKFDSEAQKANEKDKELEQEDDEGWVTVTKKSKVQSFARSENVENKIMAKEEKNKKRKELKNFYTFQIRESKMKHIVALRQKFEEDKQKIAQIKQSRRFKPF